MNRFSRLTLCALAWLVVSTGAALAQDAGDLVDAAAKWIGLLALIISVGTMIVTWLTTGSSKNAETLNNHDTRLTGHADRITRLENEIAHLPGRDTSHRLELAIQQLNGRLDTLDERLKPVASISERMQEVLLEQAKR